MAEDRDEEQRGFKVHDRRRFAESGDPKEDTEETPQRAEAESQAEPEQASPAEPEQHDHSAHDHDHGAHDHDHAHDHGPITFATFAISLSTQTLAHLGEIPGPSGTVEVDLPAARQLIDILAMLQEKTKGNLDEDESALIQHALYDLRMKYVERAQG